MNCVRCPTVMGPGEARQWGLPDKFDDLMDDIVFMFPGRGIAVLPAEQWVDTQDRPCNGLSPTQDGPQPCGIDASVHECRRSS
eukprot:6838566-Pyramimonas_sp.AAC.1